MASIPPQNVPAEILQRLDAVIGRKGQFVNEVQAWAAGPPKGGPNGDGKYPFTDATGYQVLVESPSAIAARVGTALRGPEAFGAIGDGQSHPARNYYPTLAACRAVYPFAKSLAQEMDFLAWQAMIDTEGDFQCPHTRYKMCNSDPESQYALDWCAGISDVHAAFSTLDWTEMRMKTTDQHMMPNWNFATADGWQNATIYDEPGGKITYATFDKGAAIGTDTHDGTRPGTGPYYAFGHRINPGPGRFRVIVEGTITRGTSFNHGNVNPPYGYLNFSSQYGVDQGPWPESGRSLALKLEFDKLDPEGTPAPFKGQFDIQVNGNTPGFLMFKAGGYLNVRVTRMDIMPFVPNCAILNNRDRAPEHYFMAKRFRCANLLGPPKVWTGLTCGLWKSFVSLDGDLQDWDQIRAFGWDSAAEWSDGAYLLHYYHCYMLSEGRGLYFGEGSFNAGENIKFFGGNCSAGNWIFNNPGGAEITLFGTATDYAGKGLCKDNAGIIRLIGTRHEQYHPSTPNSPIWHCTTGVVIYEACYVLLAGIVNGAKSVPAQLDTTSASIEFHSTIIYNLTSAEGIASKGPGRMTFYGFINTGNPNIGPELLTEAPNQDMLAGAGMFEPRPTEVSFVNNQQVGLDLEGGLFNLPYVGGALDQWNSTDTKLTVSTDFAWRGTKSLRVDKNGPYDNQVTNQIQLLLALPSAGNLLGRIKFLFPNAITDPKFRDDVAYPFGAPVYFRYFFVKRIGTDALGRPILARRAIFKGEKTINVPKDGSPEWIHRGFTTLYEPAGTNQEVSNRSPEWATHFMLAIDCQSIPPMTFYIDGFQANFIG